MTARNARKRTGNARACFGVVMVTGELCQGWGAKVIDRSAADLRAIFPEGKGFSSSNLKYMRFFAEEWHTGLIRQQPADQLPWFHRSPVGVCVDAGMEDNP